MEDFDQKNTLTGYETLEYNKQRGALETEDQEIQFQVWNNND